MAHDPKLAHPAIISELAWEETFRETYERASARQRKIRAKRPNLLSGEYSRRELAAAECRLTELYEQQKAKAEATPYFRVKKCRREWSFISKPRWTAVQADKGSRDARKVQAAYSARENRMKRRDAKSRAKKRLAHGFRWDGGAVGDNPSYFRHHFYRMGLVSEHYPILRLFVSKCRRARHLRSGSTKAESNKAWSKLLALDEAYIETNKVVRGVLRVESDAVFLSWNNLRAELHTRGVPLPNIAVGHMDPAGQIVHPHLFWLLESSVAFSEKGRAAPKTLFSLALEALTAALMPIGADPGGLSNPHRHKNPLSPLWDRRVFARVPYNLEQLRDGIPAVAKTAKGESLSRLIVSPLIPDHSDPSVAAQSNRVFNLVRATAYERVSWHRDEANGSPESFRAELQELALRLVRRSPKTESHALFVAERVAKWTWEKYKPRRDKRKSPAERYAARADAGRSTAESRSQETIAILVDARARLLAAGQPVTQAAVARVSSRSLRTVERQWPAVLDPVIRSTYDKKDYSTR
jgi:hypothetical protein